MIGLFFLKVLLPAVLVLLLTTTIIWPLSFLSILFPWLFIIYMIDWSFNNAHRFFGKQRLMFVLMIVTIGIILALVSLERFLTLPIASPVMFVGVGGAY